MFRDVTKKLSLRKKLTILALGGVLLPLLVLTYLQYRSLTELQNKTKGAFKDNLRQGITIVQDRMRQRLEAIAAQTLSLPDDSEKIEKFVGRSSDFRMRSPGRSPAFMAEVFG